MPKVLGKTQRNESELRSELGGRASASAGLDRLDELDVLRGEELRGRAARDAAKDNAIQQGVATQTVAAVDAAGGLARAVEATDDLVARIHALGTGVDLEAAHAVVDHRSHDGDVELVASLQRQVVVEFLAPLVPGLAAAVGLVGAALGVLGLLVGELVVVLEGRGDVLERDLVLRGELLHALVGLHDAAALVVLAMPLDLLGRLAVEAQEEACAIAQSDAVVLPHHACDVVAAAQLVAEALALHVEQHTSNTTQSLGG
mmetsp:Transcript_43558/g.110290  ORF Transcript_43558/g.110290 Transcript_43558/m.110290 type:complete len:259 (-) Transcript_43558:442-1218(-)